MRITQNTIFNNLRNQMMNNAASLLDAQEVVATQKKINRLSDDPINGGRVLDLTSALARSDQYLKNIDRAESVSNMQDCTLDQVDTILSRAKELLLAEANTATSTSDTREAARTEIVQLTQQLVQAANTRFEGQYLFSGFASDTPAFSDSAVSATASPVTGGAGVTSQAVVDASAMVYHNYQIQFTSAGQYDILDTTTGTTVAANQTYTSGSAIQFDGVQVTLSDGTGAPAAGDTFTVTTTPPGTYQGDSQVQSIEVQAGTRVAQNIPGDRIFSGTGLTGGVDVFSIMNQINNALGTNDRTAISALLDQLDTAQAQVSTVRSSVGARINMLDAIKERHDDIQTNLETLRSGLEDIDVTDAITQLNKQQNIYEATLSAGAKIVQPSLLDFLS